MFFTKSIAQGYKIYPIIVDSNNNIIDGNARLEAYKRLGVPLVEVYHESTSV